MKDGRKGGEKGRRRKEATGARKLVVGIVVLCGFCLFLLVVGRSCPLFCVGLFVLVVSVSLLVLLLRLWCCPGCLVVFFWFCFLFLLTSSLGLRLLYKKQRCCLWYSVPYHSICSQKTTHTTNDDNNNNNKNPFNLKMGGRWSDLTAAQLAAALREIGPVYEEYATFIEENGLDGKTLEDMTEGKGFATLDGFGHVLAHCDLSNMKAVHKFRLLRAVKHSESAEPNAEVITSAQERARQRVAVATATAVAKAVTATPRSNTATATAANPLLTIREVSTAQLQQMPKAVREYEPLSESVFIAALCCSPALTAAEAQILADPGDAEAVATVTLLVQQIQHVVRYEIERRLSLADTLALVKAVAAAGNRDFNNVYTAVWTRCEENDPAGIQRYKTAVAGALAEAAQHHLLAQQQAGSVAELLQHAAQCKKAFDKFVLDIVRRCCSASHPHHDADVPQAKLPETLKRVSRIIEKLQLHPTGPTDSVGHIFDVVRGMIRCQSMTDVALAVEKVTDCDSITVVRVKDRFVASPTEGGWRDCQICFFLNSDPNKHVCELQVVHEHLYNNRANLPGHLVYGRIRNALEILDVLLHSDSSVRVGLRAHNEQLKRDVDGLKAQIEELQQEYSHKVEQLEQNHTAAIEQIEQLTRDYESEVDVLKDQLQHGVAQMETLTEEHNRSTAKLQAEVQQHKLKIEEMQAQLTADQAEVRVGSSYFV